MTDYLTSEEDRMNAIINDTNQKFAFTHQLASEVDVFSYGIFENRMNISPAIPVYVSLQDNKGAGAFIRSNSNLIESAAREYGISANLVKAVLYTEMARGWYDKLNPFENKTVLPGNLDRK